uniref:Uncharacterized protein n=1 Tax=Chenopodium quinoa TaxID=63459 RepID=A0A803L2E9_CHEQI
MELGRSQPGVDEQLIVRIRVENETSEDEHDHQLNWLPGYSRMKEQLKIGPIELSFTTIRENGLRDLTLRRVRIEEKLAPASGGQQQRDFLVKSCFPNIQKLVLSEIPELEVIPEQFRDLSFLKDLTIMNCPKVKEISDWIDSLTSLKRIQIWGCPRLERLPHQMSNLSESLSLEIYGCSRALVEKCRKPTGEHWPHIQHLRRIYINPSEDKLFSHHSNNSSIIQNLPAMHPTSYDVAPSSFISPFLLGGLSLLLFFACLLVYYVRA